MTAWDDASDLLRPRANWRVDDDGYGTLIWAFGLGGAARLVVSEESAGKVRLYVSESDVDVVITPAELAVWLSQHEQEHAGYTALQVELGVHLLNAEVDELSEGKRDL